MMDWLKKGLRLVVLVSLLLLTGCLQYDLTVQFDSQTHGQWVQQLQWRRGAIAANPDLQRWVELLRDRAQQVGGHTQLRDDATLVITVPFNNGEGLATTFNDFFNPPGTTVPFTLPGGDPLTAHLTLHQGNWLLALQNHLTLTLDLTAVPDLAATGLPLLQDSQLLSGQVTIAAPWVRSPTGVFTPRQTWVLRPGTLNEIEADFWVPSPIGIGAGAIALLTLSGYGLKYRPWQRQGRSQGDR
ncbi:MAG TPA: DUF3153 domain-containing protein [Candidatus Obscuribacterales bacterium]